MMKAVIAEENKQISLRDIPVPKPGPQQVLIKVIAAAQNPTDWKHVQNLTPPGVTVGSDFAGIVEEIGDQVPPGLRKIGERVAGFIHGGMTKEEGGAFAEYVVANAGLLIPLPENFSFDDGSTIALCALTACQMLYQSLDLPDPNHPAKERIPLLVWGAASAVGLFAVQLAALANFQVVATASPANHELVKSLGAEVVFNYRDPGVSSKIKEYAHGNLEYAVDCISTGNIPKLVSECFGDKGGKVGHIVSFKPNDEMRKDVTFKSSLVYTLIGLPVFGNPSNPEHVANGEKWCQLITGLLAENKLKLIPIKVYPKGLADVQEGLKYMKDGHVHAEKIVYRIADTP